jgi:DNA replication protein
MKQFAGFPVRMEFTPVPNILFSAVIPEIDDIAELKAVLYIIKALYQKRGHLRFVTAGELAGDISLMQGLKGEGESPAAKMTQALTRAVKRGILLHLAVVRDGAVVDIYFLNTGANRQNIAKIKSGELTPEGIKLGEQPPAGIEAPPDIFTLYEQNIGVLTPMIAEELREALKLYPEPWIGEAIKEAVSLNKRSWRYIARILERWSAEGRADGVHRRHPSWNADSDKYIKGPYGHLVQR